MSEKHTQMMVRAYKRQLEDVVEDYKDKKSASYPDYYKGKLDAYEYALAEFNKHVSFYLGNTDE